MRIRQGSVYWLDNCRPLDGDVAKRRPVVVIVPPANESDSGAIVAAITTRPSTDPTAIALPTKATEPQTKSGLVRPCWLIPRWYLFVERSRLTDYAGYLTGEKLRVVVAAVKAAMDAT